MKLLENIYCFDKANVQCLFVQKKTKLWRQMFAELLSSHQHFILFLVLYKDENVEIIITDEWCCPHNSSLFVNKDNKIIDHIHIHYTSYYHFILSYEFLDFSYLLYYIRSTSKYARYLITDVQNSEYSR